ncbi:MAG: STAS/SEC14 domain-containing protein [Acidobacteriota bacterium]
MSVKTPFQPDETIRLAKPPTRESFVRAGASEILIVDWSGGSAGEVRESMLRVRTILESRNGRKTLMLVNITGTRWDAKLPFEIPGWAGHIGPFVGRLAIVGVAGLQQAVLSGIRALTRQPMPTFPNVDEAKTWLTRPKRDAGTRGPGVTPLATTRLPGSPTAPRS